MASCCLWSGRFEQPLAHSAHDALQDSSDKLRIGGETVSLAIFAPPTSELTECRTTLAFAFIVAPIVSLVQAHYFLYPSVYRATQLLDRHIVIVSRRTRRRRFL